MIQRITIALVPVAFVVFLIGDLTGPGVTTDPTLGCDSIVQTLFAEDEPALPVESEFYDPTEDCRRIARGHAWFWALSSTALIAGATAVVITARRRARRSENGRDARVAPSPPREPSPSAAPH